MARAYVTLGKVRGEDAWEMVFGPETGYEIQRPEFKAAKATGTHPRYELLEIWERGGACESVRLRESDGVKESASAPPPSDPAGSETPSLGDSPADPEEVPVDPPTSPETPAPSAQTPEDPEEVSDDPAEEFAAGKTGKKRGR